MRLLIVALNNYFSVSVKLFVSFAHFSLLFWNSSLYRKGINGLPGSRAICFYLGYFWIQIRIFQAVRSAGDFLHVCCLLLSQVINTELIFRIPLLPWIYSLPLGSDPTGKYSGGVGVS